MGLLCSERGGGTETEKPTLWAWKEKKRDTHPGNLKKVSGVNLFITKGKLDFNQALLYMKFRITNCCTQLESNGCFCVS